jgi:two-component system, cell cycle response regulator
VNGCVKWRYLTYVTVLMALSVMVRGVYDYHEHQKKLTHDISQMAENAQLYYQDLQQALVERYLTLTHHYANEPRVQVAINQNQREALFFYSNPDYQRLQQDNPSLHVMHYFDADNTTVLRLHQPNSYGDNLTDYRPIVRDANQFKIPLQGFEVGKNGITYRISTPLINLQGEHFGLLEFGIEPHYFVERLNRRFGVESMILVKTEALEKLTRDYQFESFDLFSIIDKTSFFDVLLDKLDLSSPINQIQIENKHYLVVSHLNQLSHQGETVAKIVIAKDITELVKENYMALVKANLVNFTLLLVLLLVVYLIFNGYSRVLARSAQTILNLSKAQDQLKNQANTDELTGLYNRRFFNVELKKLVDLRHPGCLFLFDIDHFKILNDSYGHQAGDKVLVELANMMRNFFRQNDLLVRWGGEEFAVFIKDIPNEVVLQKLEAFRQYIETHATDQQPYAFTISGGVTNVRLDDDLTCLVQRADQRLYQAKQSGRNRIVSAFDENTPL